MRTQHHRRGYRALLAGAGAAALLAASPGHAAEASAPTRERVSELRAQFPRLFARTADRLTGVWFPETASGFVRIREPRGELKIAFRVAGASSAQIQQVEDLAVARVSGSDWLLRGRSDGVEDYLVFSERPRSPRVRYEIDLESIAGLRQIGSVLEMLDAQGTPVFRVSPPYVIDARGRSHAATLETRGCLVDTSPAPPWGRPVTPPGARYCALEIDWSSSDVAYPAVLDPSWTTTQAMAEARSCHAAVRLANGRVLVVGGTSPNGQVLTSAELYDPETNTWAATQSASVPRMHPGSLLNLADGTAMLLGGCTYQNCQSGPVTVEPLPPSETYQPSTGMWVRAPSPAIVGVTTRYVGLRDGRVLATGGCKDNPSCTSTEIFDGSWRPAAPFAEPRFAHAAVLLNDGRVMVVGGLRDAYTATAGCELYDPARDSWTVCPAVGAPRAEPKATVLDDGRVLVYSGSVQSPCTTPGCTFPDTKPASTFEILESNAWKVIASTRAGHALALSADEVLFVGAPSNASFPPAEILTLPAGSSAPRWMPTSMSEARSTCFSATTLADRRVLVAGGINHSEQVTAGAELLQPTSGSGGSGSGGLAGTAGSGGSLASGGSGGTAGSTPLRCGSNTMEKNGECVGEDGGCGCALPRDRNPFSAFSALGFLTLLLACRRSGQKPRRSRRRVALPLAVFAAVGLVSACGDDPQARAVAAAPTGGTDAGAGTGGESNGGSSGVSGFAGSAGASSDAGVDAPPDGSSSGGASGETGSGGTGGEAGSTTGTGGMPGGAGCGNGVRDPATEECDDNNSATDDACDHECRVTDFLVAAPVAGDAGPGRSRYVGNGRHPVAAGSAGFAVAFIEEHLGASRVLVSAFNTAGVRTAASIRLDDPGSTAKAVAFSDPVVAALPGGKYAAAWTDYSGDGDELGIALTLVDPLGPLATASGHANQATDFSQFDPDILPVSNQLVVAWVDASDPLTAPDLKYRTFDTNLAPTANEVTLASSAAAETSVALSRFGSSWAAAWRSGEAGTESIKVQVGSTSFSVGPFLPGHVEDRPALLEVDADTLLLVFTARADAPDGGGSNAFRLRGALLEMAAPGSVTAFPLEPSIDAGPTQPAQTHPNAVRVQNRMFIAYRTERVAGNPAAEDLWIRELTISGSTVSLDPPQSLPTSAAQRFDDQRFPALAGAAFGAEGAVIAAWEDYGRSLGSQAGTPDVVAELIPLPMLALESEGLAR